MHRRILPLCLAAPLFLSGCSLNGSIDTMLTPPKLSVEQEQIYKALQDVAGQNISLKYPKSGSYLSAFIVDDIDYDGQDEAVVFYEKNVLSAEENPLRISILDQLDGAWRSVYDRPAAGAEIEQVFISKLGENDRVNLIVGYSLVSQSERTVEVYDYQNGALECTLSKPYSAIDVGNFDGDLSATPENELLIVCGQSASRQASAAMYRLTQTGTYYESVVPLGETFTDVAKVVHGKAADGTSCIYLDGVTGAGTIQTQILTAANGVLIPTYADTPDNPVKTTRPAGYGITDIDEDGIADLPLTGVFPGYAGMNPSEQITMTNWYGYRSGALVRNDSSYYSINDGYAFLLPPRWEKKVTVKLDQVAGDVVFYKYENSVEESKTELLRFCVTDDADQASDKLKSGYLLLGAKGGKQYLAKILDSTDSLRPTVSEVVFSFLY